MVRIAGGRLLSAFLALVLVACSSGGGGGDDGSPPGGPGGGNTGPQLSLALQDGARWGFFWTIESTTFAQGSGSSSTSESGKFAIKLGAPVIIQGAEAFPFTISGSTGSGTADFEPRWTHVALVNGVLMGSSDGVTLQPIFDPSDGTMTGGGFFLQFGPSETVSVEAGTFTGEYNVLSAFVVSHGSASGGCEVILGVTICSDSSTSFSETEYHKNGIGPVGMKRSISYSSSGGGFFSSHQIRHVVELIETSLAATDGSLIKRPPWEGLPALGTPRKNHSSAVYDGRIYVFGGHDAADTALSSVEIFDPTTNTWTGGASSPISTAFHVARTVGNSIYLIPSSTAQPIRIYDPVQNTWSTGVMGVYSDPSHDADVGVVATGPVQGTFIVSVTPNGAFTNALYVYAYRPSDNAWYGGTTLTNYTDHRWGAVTIAGSNLYLIGGYRQRLAGPVFGNTLRYNLSTDEWAQNVGVLNVARYNARAVTLNGEPVVLGGTNGTKDLREVEAYSEATGTWRALPPMLRARENFSAVVVDGKIYAIGGSSGTATLGEVEVYTPQ